MNPYAKLVSLFSIILGSTITMSSTHWILAWAGLEINTLAVIPLISKSHHPRAVEATIKYFLVQASASTLILFSSMSNAWYTGQWDITELNNPLSSLLLTTAIAMKLGLVPFHFWLPEVLQGSSLPTGLLLSTLIKLPPLTIFTLISPSLNPTILTLLAIASALLGGWMGLNQTQIRKILAFSSISHLGWMCIIITYNPKLTILTFSFYTLITASAFLSLNTINTTNIPTLMTSWTKTPTLNASLMLTLLSLAGLPPLSGFLPKWMILQELVNQELTPTAIIISMLSLLGLFFYLRLAYYATITLPPNTTNHMKHWYINKTSYTYTSIFSSFSITLLPLSPLILTMV
uniref:NADH-ubiquinone oxidoreductase chain 2 n=1 Tax=Eudromia elegans TaxID=8805 RepID=Q9B6T3_EUDEL|nr:NADH dehydrogenase subunit 2 [Eudromia elegans]AAK08584.1 NADH dehydrogenase subunit 2 [Eudromia elegans]AAK53285.1 NADH dehydrogenase subunit II [Eudromia elegans]AAQ23390.1 NADH dehydrogenase subunit 2 [Eudromia elegans]QNS38475.1 NADH dehydrogenase subunit 2 [Eudromia elegans]UXX61798.1 NADH dehydrogenase subunit 2 [Eudromia elegans]